MSKVIERKKTVEKYKITVQRITEFEVTYQDDRQVWKQLMCQPDFNRGKDFGWVDNPNQESYLKTEKEQDTIFEQVVDGDGFKIGEVIKAVNYDNI